ncbi:MAG: DUF2490 domain-containing protein [Candidatus Margulisbacteria bacterium]|nr:DUF2490 domain-containing protein [Candidatus Margulisiibacteriota bacterium]
MVKRLLVSACLLLIGLGVALADTEFWTVNTVQIPVKQGVSFSLIPELRVRSNLSELYYLRTYFGPTFSINNNLGLSVYYAPTATKSAATGNWSTSNILVGDAVSAWPLISNRWRLEYDYGTALLKVRDRVQLKYNGWVLGEEPFYNCQRGYIDENRASLGYSIKLTDRFSLEPGWLLRSQRTSSGGSWTNTNIVTVNSSIKI